jgi:hypothetical protein
MAKPTRPRWPAMKIFAGEGRSYCERERERERENKNKVRVLEI